jgi:hypothetical protein
VRINGLPGALLQLLMQAAGEKRTAMILMHAKCYAIVNSLK